MAFQKFASDTISLKLSIPMKSGVPIEVQSVNPAYKETINGTNENKKNPSIGARTKRYPALRSLA